MESLLNILLTAHKSFLAKGSNQPFILLSWAQTLDGKLAAAPGTRTPISGATSMEMTHALRALHDSILVGIGTVLADDPRLTCRLSGETRELLQTLLPRYDRTMPDDVELHPRVVVLDARGRTPATSKFLSLPHAEVERRRPILFVGREEEVGPIVYNKLESRCIVETVSVCTKGTHERTRLDLSAIIAKLSDAGVKSVMVEGGASVIASFLDSGLCDILIVTVSPTLFGSGLAYSAGDGSARAFNLTNLHNPKWIQLGDDVVVIGAPK